MDSHAETIEKQKEKIRDLQTEREAAATAAASAREQVVGALPRQLREIALSYDIPQCVRASIFALVVFARS